MLKKILGSLTTALMISACATSPTGRSQLIFMPDNQVNQMGLQAFSEMKQKQAISRSPAYNRVVQCVANALTAPMGGNWEVVVFEDDSLNAFALPGSKIGVHTGLLKVIQNPDQLAAVVGHEIGHVIAKHSNERLSQEVAVKTGMNVAGASGMLGATSMALLGLGAQYGVLLPYSRTHESEADLIGLDLMAKAGFDPRQSITLWQIMDQASRNSPQQIEFMSTHPGHETRMQNLQQHMNQALNTQQQALAAGRQPRCNP